LETNKRKEKHQAKNDKHQINKAARTNEDSIVEDYARRWIKREVDQDPELESLSDWVRTIRSLVIDLVFIILSLMFFLSFICFQVSDVSHALLFFGSVINSINSFLNICFLDSVPLC
jgi:hypothetical protein